MFKIVSPLWGSCGWVAFLRLTPQAMKFHPSGVFNEFIASISFLGVLGGFARGIYSTKHQAPSTKHQAPSTKHFFPMFKISYPQITQITQIKARNAFPHFREDKLQTAGTASLGGIN